MTMTVKEKFLRYVQVETTSEATCETCPSSPNQLVLANMLVDELKAMGVANARVDEHGYVYATIPARGDHPAKVGLIAHMDTSDGVRGATKPVCIPHYDGKPVTLANGVVIDGFDFLPSLAGQELIVTSGDSVLGADDKAGVAEIMALAQRLMAPDAPEHCTVCIGFTPDEEIGRGADLFDVPGFGADYAYTVDGGAIGEIEYENFNAAAATVVFNGRNIHPGSAKNKMINSQYIAMEFQSLLPQAQKPEHTEGYEGFFHLNGMNGTVEETVLRYIIRDHDMAKFEEKKSVMETLAAFIDRKYGVGTCELTIRDNYFNMKQQIEPVMYIVDRVKDAMRSMGIEPKEMPIRGGTDGARLSYEGLPCPNICTGGENFHGRFEYIPVEDMEKISRLLVEILTSAT